MEKLRTELETIFSPLHKDTFHGLKLGRLIKKKGMMMVQMKFFLDYINCLILLQQFLHLILP